MTGGDIVLRPTNSNFNKKGPCTLFFPPYIFSITISCNDFTFHHFLCIFLSLVSLVFVPSVVGGSVDGEGGFTKVMNSKSRISNFNFW